MLTFYEAPRPEEPTMQVYDGCGRRVLWALYAVGQREAVQVCFERDDAGNFGMPITVPVSKGTINQNKRGVYELAKALGITDVVFDGLSGLLYVDISEGMPAF